MIRNLRFTSRKIYTKKTQTNKITQSPNQISYSIRYNQSMR